jgi:hypothetical protein
VTLTNSSCKLPATQPEAPPTNAQNTAKRNKLSRKIIKLHDTINERTQTEALPLFLKEKFVELQRIR